MDITIERYVGCTCCYTLSVKENGHEIGRATLHIIPEEHGHHGHVGSLYVECVEEGSSADEIRTDLLKKLYELARKEGCYKIALGPCIKEEYILNSDKHSLSES